MVDIKAMAAATAPREFELSYTTTIEDVYEKLSTHASAFKMPFKIKGGIPGKRISFEKEPNLDVTVWVFVKDGNKIKVMANIQENTTTVNGMRVDKNSVIQKGVSGVANLPIQRGEYLDEVTENVKKILNGEQVEDYVAARWCKRQWTDGKGLACSPSSLPFPRRSWWPPFLCGQSRIRHSLSFYRRRFWNRCTC